jgi:hypothetical protein
MLKLFSRWTQYALILAAAVCSTRGDAANLQLLGGPTMQGPVKIYLIFWQPPGVIFDNAPRDGVGNFKSLMARMLADISGSDYLNIVTQYPSTCSSNANGCALKNVAGAVTLAGSWTDTRAYPVHSGLILPRRGQGGTQTDPLTDADIQAEVLRAISQNNWTNDANSEFFVITGAFKAKTIGSIKSKTIGGGLNPVEECFGINCTFKGAVQFCGYHWSFSSNGSTFLYSYLSDASFSSAGCSENLTSATNGQLTSDREVALFSHELFESLTDPLVNTNQAWADPTTTNNPEIGDLCNQQPGSVSMNGNNYAVQQQWSNFRSSCVTSYSPSFSQITFDVVTGGDDLRGDSSATADFSIAGTQVSFVLKAQDAGSWDNNSTHSVTVALNPPAPISSFGDASLTLHSHNSIVETDDNWNVQSIIVTLNGPQQSLLPQQSLCYAKKSGNPFIRLTGSNPSVTLHAQDGC